MEVHVRLVIHSGLTRPRIDDWVQKQGIASTWSEEGGREGRREEVSGKREGGIESFMAYHEKNL